MKSKFPIYALIASGLVAIMAIGFYTYLSMSKRTPEPAEGQTTEQKNVAVVGKLITDDSRKGTPLIETTDGPVFLIEEDGSTKINKNLNGQTVEAKGELVTKVCDPYEQCLTEGTMRFLQDIAYISVVEK